MRAWAPAWQLVPQQRSLPQPPKWRGDYFKLPYPCYIQLTLVLAHPSPRMMFPINRFLSRIRDKSFHIVLVQSMSTYWYCTHDKGF